MKFLTKINRNYFLLLSFILIVVSVGGYFFLDALILDEAKENLLSKEDIIEKQIFETGEIPYLFPIIEINKINEITLKTPVYKEVFIKDELEQELEPYLEYSNQIKIRDSFYSIKLRQSSLERNDLILILALFIFVLLLSAFGISFIISKKMNKTIWADFEHNLKEVEYFNFNENKFLNLLKSDVEEFDRLNKVLNNLTKKLKDDYFSLKEFTENASHEIQTPLSIVLLNLEEVIQQELNPETFKKVVSSINALKRLSTLNQSLILLTKIENRQFKADRTIIINDIVIRKVEEFETFFESKNLKVVLQTEQNFELKMNEQLAEVLISNLLSNAVNHNIAGGNIIISIHEKELKICNTGKSNYLTNETIFQRFSKGNSKSFGLGLAIIKKICDTHNLGVNYSKEELHCFAIFQKL
jgi:signal transduction histidine kinase